MKLRFISIALFYIGLVELVASRKGIVPINIEYALIDMMPLRHSKVRSRELYSFPLSDLFLFRAFRCLVVMVLCGMPRRGTRTRRLSGGVIARREDNGCILLRGVSGGGRRGSGLRSSGRREPEPEGRRMSRQI